MSTATGVACGRVEGMEVLLKLLDDHSSKYDAVAIASTIDVPPGYHREYFQSGGQMVNPWGGAIAHGHPLGATGAGLMAKMLTGLEAIGGQFGLQVMCIGHGMSTATIIERI